LLSGERGLNVEFTEEIIIGMKWGDLSCQTFNFAFSSNTCTSPVTYTCNPSYSGGRDQEDHSSKPIQANISQDPISKKTLHKKELAG
jgi:hypothetical protein